MGKTFTLEPLVPKFELAVLNEEETTRAMGVAVKERLVKKLTSGEGAKGPLPAPKDGGRPMQRSGLLLSTIGAKVDQNKRGVWEAIVRATGGRPDQERRAKLAGRRQRAKRAALVERLTAEYLRSGSVDARYMRRTPTKRGQIFKASSVKDRGGRTNAAIVAILSQPPKDLRSRNGHRATYRVFEATDEYRRLARDVADRVMKVDLTAT